MPDDGDIFGEIYGNSGNQLPVNGGTLPNKDGAPGLAKAIGRNYERYTAAFVEPSELERGDFASKSLGNLMKDLFKKVGPKLLRLPFATRFPMEPKGQKGWSELVDPVSQLIPETAVPLGPISPDTRQRKLVRVLTGKRGISSHINILVDTSGSMSDGSTYATIQDDEGRLVISGGRFSTRWVASLLIAQAKQLGDSFSLFTFEGSTVRALTRGASRGYDEAIEWLQSTDEDFLNARGKPDPDAMPFPSGGGTPMGLGIAAVCATMNENRRKIAGALTIVIGDGEPNGGLRAPIDGGWRGTDLNKYVKSWDDNGYPQYRSDYNPGNDPRLHLNDAYLRRSFGPVIYVMVGGSEDEANLQRISTGIACELQNFYNGTNFGAAQRSRQLADGSTEVQTRPMLGNDRRLGTTEAGGWTAWSWTHPPTYGVGLSRPAQGDWQNPGMRGPCLACGISFSIASGTIGLETFGGSLLAMARAGKGGDLQQGCFTRAKSAR